MVDPWQEDRKQKYLKLAATDRAAFLALLENSGSVMFAPQMDAAADLLRELWDGKATNKPASKAKPEATTTRRRRRRG